MPQQIHKDQTHMFWLDICCSTQAIPYQWKMLMIFGTSVIMLGLLTLSWTIYVSLIGFRSYFTKETHNGSTYTVHWLDLIGAACCIYWRECIQTLYTIASKWRLLYVAYFCSFRLFSNLYASVPGSSHLLILILFFFRSCTGNILCTYSVW